MLCNVDIIQFRATIPGVHVELILCVHELTTITLTRLGIIKTRYAIPTKLGAVAFDLAAAASRLHIRSANLLRAYTRTYT